MNGQEVLLALAGAPDFGSSARVQIQHLDLSSNCVGRWASTGAARDDATKSDSEDPLLLDGAWWKWGLQGARGQGVSGKFGHDGKGESKETQEA